MASAASASQIFTVIYFLTGFGVLVALLTSVAQQDLAHKAEGGRPRERLRPAAP